MFFYPKLLGAIFALFFLFFCWGKLATPALAVANMPLISSSVAAFDNDDCGGNFPASNANDSSYDTFWWGDCLNSGPPSGFNEVAISPSVWLSYDLSSVPSSKRGQVIVAWYNDCCSYDTAISGTGAFNIPSDYTIEANSAAGGGSSPSSGWVTLVTVTNNTYHSRQHLVDLTGYNWVRINISSSLGADQNYGAKLNMDVFDASGGVTDDWIFYGDSIAEGAMSHATVGTTKSFSELISNETSGANFPIMENGGIGSQSSTSALTFIDAQLALFPGKYVILEYGNNDALTPPSTYYDNMAALVQKVLDAGKVPIVPTITWNCETDREAAFPALIDELNTLYANYPQIIKGPDFYTYFNEHQDLLANDCIHPSSPDGMAEWRQLWADTMFAAVYNAPVVSEETSTAGPSSSEPAAPSANCPSGFKYCIDEGPNMAGPTSWNFSNSAGIYLVPNSSSMDIHIDINKITAAGLLALPSLTFPWAQGFNTVSDIYQFNAVSSFNGYPVLNLDKPATVLLPYDPAKLNKLNPSALRLAYWDSLTKKWKLIVGNTVVNPTSHTLANTTKLLGYFAIVYPVTTIKSSAVTETLKTQAPPVFQTPTPLPSQKPAGSPAPTPKPSKNCFLFFCW